MTASHFWEQSVHLNVNQNSTQCDLLHNGCHTLFHVAFHCSTLGTKKHFVICQISRTTDILGDCTSPDALINGIMTLAPLG